MQLKKDYHEKVIRVFIITVMILVALVILEMNSQNKRNATEILAIAGVLIPVGFESVRAKIPE